MLLIVLWLIFKEKKTFLQHTLDYKFMLFIWEEHILWSLTKKTVHGGVTLAKVTKEEPEFSSVQTGNERGRAFCFPVHLLRVNSLTPNLELFGTTPAWNNWMIYYCLKINTMTLEYTIKVLLWFFYSLTYWFSFFFFFVEGEQFFL